MAEIRAFYWSEAGPVRGLFLGIALWISLLAEQLAADPHRLNGR